MQVPLKPIPWPKGKSERVSVNCFGIGGTNVHVQSSFLPKQSLSMSLTFFKVILDSFTPVSPPRVSTRAACPSIPQLLVLSAKNGKSLQKGQENIQRYITRCPVAVHDLVHTLGTRREHMAHRAFAIMDQVGGLSSFEKSQVTKSSIVFLFSGQGAQWVGMGRELLSTSPRFLRSIQAMDLALSKLENPPSWTLEGN